MTEIHNSNIVVEIERQRPKPRWFVNFADFANMVKAFIGSNYLSVAYAFSQSGLALGIGGMLLIAGLTDHCCQLLVKTKYQIIKNILDKQKKERQANGHTQNNRNSYNSYERTPRQPQSGSDDDDFDDTIAPFIARSIEQERAEMNNEPEINMEEQEAYMKTHMTFGDIGKICFGKVGIGMVNFCIALTQFGFCVGYFIFLGNTIYSLFPVQKCYIDTVTQQENCHVIITEEVFNNSSLGVNGSHPSMYGYATNAPASSILDSLQSHSSYMTNSNSAQKNINKRNIESSAVDRLHTIAPIHQSQTTGDQTTLEPTTMVVPSGNMTTLSPSNITTVTPSNMTTLDPSNITTVTPSNMTTLDPSNVTTITPSNITTSSPINTTTVTPPSNTTTVEPNTTTVEPNTTTMFPFSNITTAWKVVIVDHAPNLIVLVAAPLPIFIIFALIRSVRYLGVVSVLANISILFGCISIFGFLIVGFHVSKSVILVNVEGFTVFFGMVTGAFEGIGLVIPIESSMVGNRHLFPMFLHLALLVLTVILGFFGIFGYLKNGTNVHQMLNKNIPRGHPLGMGVNIGICIGILLTFPLQIFPVIEIVERLLFTQGAICGPSQKKESLDEQEQLMGEDRDPLLSDDTDIAARVPDSVPTWKRNIVRIVIVLIACGLAILLRHYFAYVGAFIGSVGSAVLGFILPCLFHLKICWNDLSIFVKAKDIFIIVFGFVASFVCAISVIQRVIAGVISS